MVDAVVFLTFLWLAEAAGQTAIAGGDAVQAIVPPSPGNLPNFSDNHRGLSSFLFWQSKKAK